MAIDPNNPKKNVRRRKEEKPIPNKKVKAGTKAGGKGLLIGGAIFVLLIILLIFGFFFYLTSHPNAAKGFGISAKSVKSITYVFAGLVFGSFFIIFLVMGLSYLYKLFTKQTGKGRNLVGVIVIFILGIINITLGFLVFSRISKIKVEEVIMTNDVIVAYANYLDANGKEKLIPFYDNNFPLIGPMKVSYQLNKTYYNREINKLINREGNITPDKFVIDCGNGQKLEYYDYKFDQTKYCLYTTKGKYKAKLVLHYRTPKAKNTVKKYTFAPKEINIISQVGVKGKIEGGEEPVLLVGERGAEIKYDLREIPTDLSLSDYYLYVDFARKVLGNTKEPIEFKKYKGIVNYVYSSDGKHEVVIKIPEISEDIYYYFPILVAPSTRPICTIEEKEKNGKYEFIIHGEKTENPIRKYISRLENLTDGTRKEKKDKRYKTTLSNGKKYQFVGIVIDTKGKKGMCKSNIIDLTDKINYKYDLYLNGEKVEDEEITVNKLPFKGKLEIKNIIPDSDDLKVGFDVDGDGEIDEEGKEYEFKISKKTGLTLTSIVEDRYGNKSLKTLTFKVKLSPIIGKLKADKNKGESPLTVQFDASESEVTNEDDEIVYFNRDFGDGVKNEDTRQGTITHTYNTPGTYTAKVELVTEKGYRTVATKKIFVRKPVYSTRLIFPNNLGGTARKGDSVKMELRTSGPVESIVWDFGDGETYSCEGRECQSMSHSYEKTGKFEVKAKVLFSDGSPSNIARSTIVITDATTEY